MIASLKLKLIAGMSVVIIILGMTTYIHYQANKITKSENQVENLQRDLLEAHIAFDTQQASYNIIKHELLVSHKTIDQMNKSLGEITERYSSLKKDIDELRKNDNEVDAYLNTTIPTNLLDRLYQRSH